MRKNVIEKNGLLFKPCSICKELKPLDEKHYGQAVYGAGGNIHGFYPQCRECKRNYRQEQGKQRYKDNPSNIQTNNKAYATKNYSKRFDYSFIADQYPSCLKEVPTIYGCIDVLTDSHIIEVKKFQYWKKGIGQLVTFKLIYPNHSLLLVLLGNVAKDISLIDDACTKLGIECRYHIY